MCRFSLQRDFVLGVRVTCILIVLNCFSGGVLKTVEQGLQNCTVLETRLDEFKLHSSWQLGDRDMAKMHPHNGRSQNFGSNPLFAPPPYGA